MEYEMDVVTEWLRIDLDWQLDFSMYDQLDSTIHDL
jgi:hypothetical protein